MPSLIIKHDIYGILWYPHFDTLINHIMLRTLRIVHYQFLRLLLT